MSMSLRDQLLQAGLVSKKQVQDAERQQQRQTRHQPKSNRATPARGTADNGAANHGTANIGTPTHGTPAHGTPAHRTPAHETPAHETPAAPQRAQPPRSHNPKKARDQALNRQQQEKARKKDLAAQIKQLVEANRLPAIEGGDFYNFVDGTKIRHIPVDPTVRARLMRGDIVIVRHAGGYDLLPAAVGARVRERDASAVVANVSAASVPIDDAYAAFTVPDDLMW